MIFLRTICWITIALVTMQCSSKDKSSAKNECNAPLPQAIFDKTSTQIEAHNFALEGHNATENISFQDKSTLIIYQSGCDKIAQEFRFQLRPQKEMDLPSLAVDRLMFLANLDDKYMSFANWAQAVEGLRKEFATQKEVEVEAGFFVGLDKIDSKDGTLMIIRLFQK